MLYQEKSGNPGEEFDTTLNFRIILKLMLYVLSVEAGRR
jgi:hypothetical protein